MVNDMRKLKSGKSENALAAVNKFFLCQKYYCKGISNVLKKTNNRVARFRVMFFLRLWKFVCCLCGASDIVLHIHCNQRPCTIRWSTYIFHHTNACNTLCSAVPF